MGSRKQLDQLADELPSNQKRLRVIRQDRINVEDMDCHLEFGHTNYKIINITPFGVLTQTNNDFSGDVINANLIVENVDLGTVKLRQARQEADIDGRRLVAFEVLGEPVSVDRVLAIRDSIGLIKGQEQYQSTTKRIPDAFARKVYEIKDWLEELQEKTLEFERRKNKTDIISYAEYENTVVQVVGEYLNKLMPAKNQEVGALIQDFNADAVKNCYEFFRAKLLKLIYQAPFADRVYSKPLGYAGDYEMMNIIYRDDNAGDSLFAKCLHNYWNHQPAAQAVRNRADYIRSKIGQVLAARPNESLQFLSVASGPAMEWQQLISAGEHNNRDLEIGLLDQDEGALKYAQRRIREASFENKNKFHFQYIDRSIKNVIARGLDEQYDFIYSAGLFDYFSDAVAQLAADKLFKALKPGGQLVIGNFNVENPNSIMMDLALDWHLIYRTRDDLIRLFGGTGGKISVESEPLSINLFCTISKL